MDPLRVAPVVHVRQHPPEEQQRANSLLHSLGLVGPEAQPRRSRRLEGAGGVGSKPLVLSALIPHVLVKVRAREVVARGTLLIRHVHDQRRGRAQRPLTLPPRLRREELLAEDVQLRPHSLGALHDLLPSRHPAAHLPTVADGEQHLQRRSLALGHPLVVRLRLVDVLSIVVVVDVRAALLRRPFFRRTPVRPLRQTVLPLNRVHDGVDLVLGSRLLVPLLTPRTRRIVRARRRILLLLAKVEEVGGEPDSLVASLVPQLFAQRGQARKPERARGGSRAPAQVRDAQLPVADLVVRLRGELVHVADGGRLVFGSQRVRLEPHGAPGDGPTAKPRGPPEAVVRVFRDADGLLEEASDGAGQQGDVPVGSVLVRVADGGFPAADGRLVLFAIVAVAEEDALVQELIAEVHDPAFLDGPRGSLVVGLRLRGFAQRRLGGSEPGVRVREFRIVSLLLHHERVAQVVAKVGRRALAVELLGEVHRVLEHALGQRHRGSALLVQRRAHLHDPLGRLAHPTAPPIPLGVAQALEQSLAIYRIGGQRRDRVDQGLHGCRLRALTCRSSTRETRLIPSFLTAARSDPRAARSNQPYYPTSPDVVSPRLARRRRNKSGIWNLSSVFQGYV